MSLSTYQGLKTAVASWCHRTDLTAQIVDFVTLAEAQIRRDVRCRAMEQVESGTLTGETLAHPTRYLEARRVAINGAVYDYVTPGQYQQLKDANSQQQVYSSIGQSLYILNGASGDAYTLIYFQGFAPFTASADTNWLLQNAPEIYLSGALIHAGMFLMDDALAAKHAAIYKGSLNNLRTTENAARYSGATLEIRGN